MKKRIPYSKITYTLIGIMILFDSHLHLNHTDFAGQEAQTWNAAVAQGVTQGVVVGFDLESSAKAIRLAETLPGLCASVGVSPHDILQAPVNYLEQIQTLALHPRVVAIGETGLEYHYPVGPKEMQRQYLTQQAQLADRLHKPLIIHLREADEDFLQFLQNTAPASAVLHCFTASEAVLRASLKRDYFISFSGMITFKNADILRQLASQVPDEHLLIETDAPYLAPVPYRGKTCEPKMMVKTAQKMAELRGTDLITLGALTRANAQRAFQLVVSEG